MKIACISFTSKGEELLLRLRELLPSAISCRLSLYTKRGQAAEDDIIIRLEESIDSWTSQRFTDSDAIIFVGACGIAVRAIAPYIRSKDKDPAVLVMDEGGRWVISVLSGHLGGANELALSVGRALGAEPVITTATDLNNIFAVDLFAKKNDLYIGSMKLAKEISAALLDGRQAAIRFDKGITVSGSLPSGLKLMPHDTGLALMPGSRGTEAGLALIPGNLRTGTGLLSELRLKPSEAGPMGMPGSRGTEAGLPDGQMLPSNDRLPSAYGEWPWYGINVSVDDQTSYFRKNLNLVPRCVCLGVGVRKGKSPGELEEFILSVLEKEKISIHAVLKVCSIDLKKTDEAVNSFCRKYGIDLDFFSARQLEQLDGEFSSSEFVRSITAVDNVCERSAVLGALEAAVGRKALAFPKTDRASMLTGQRGEASELVQATDETARACQDLTSGSVSGQPLRSVSISGQTTISGSVSCHAMTSGSGRIEWKDKADILFRKHALNGMTLAAAIIKPVTITMNL